jgi:hypothetical protein
MNSYASIGSFGPQVNNSVQANPLSYCALSGLDSGFMHTLGSGSGLIAPGSGQCQLFMAQYCASNPEGWNGVCEYLSQDTKRGGNPNTVQQCNGFGGSCFGPGLGNALTNGQILIRNTAQEKYLKAMSGNCKRVYEPFDPTVAGSPLISKWVPMGNACGSAANCHSANQCIPIYGVDPSSIDDDIIMNKILAQPWIAMDILVNMYNHSSRNGDLQRLVGTKLHKFFTTLDFQNIVSSKMYQV